MANVSEYATIEIDMCEPHAWIKAIIKFPSGEPAKATFSFRNNKDFSFVHEVPFEVIHEAHRELVERYADKLA